MTVYATRSLARHLFLPTYEGMVPVLCIGD